MASATLSGGGRVVAGQQSHQAELVEGPGLAEPVAEVAEQVQGLALVSGGGRVVPGQPSDPAKHRECVGLVERDPTRRNRGSACWRLAAAAG